MYQGAERKSIRIKSGAWLGTNCVILPGVTVGKNSVVGAGVVVSKDLPDYNIMVSAEVRIAPQIGAKLKDSDKISN